MVAELRQAEVHGEELVRSGVRNFVDIRVEAGSQDEIGLTRGGFTMGLSERCASEAGIRGCAAQRPGVGGRCGSSKADHL